MHRSKRSPKIYGCLIWIKRGDVRRPGCCGCSCSCIGRKPMKYVSKSAIAISLFACTSVLSFGWSEQGGVSLSVESAQARVGRPLTPVSVAGVARRQNRRAAYAGYYGGQYAGNPNNVGGLVGGDDPGTAPRYAGGRYYGSGVWNAQASYAAPMGSAAGWYLTPSGMACTSGTWIAGGDGLPFLCP